MCEKLNILLIILMAILSFTVFGQENDFENIKDNIEKSALLNEQDSTFNLFNSEDEGVLIIEQNDKNIKIIDNEYKPDPIRAIWIGSVIPGYGQIINKKYWKLPIVYAGFLGCFYAVDFNSRQYIDFKNAYLDIIDDDDSTNSFLELIPEGYTIDSYGGKNAFGNLLKSGMEKSRYNRDLSVIITIAYYGLTLIDAFVDAHLFDYDISPDLSLKFRPLIIKEKNQYNQLAKNQTAFGLSASLNF